MANSLKSQSKLLSTLRCADTKSVALNNTTWTLPKPPSMVLLHTMSPDVKISFGELIVQPFQEDSVLLITLGAATVTISGRAEYLCLAIEPLIKLQAFIDHGLSAVADKSHDRQLALVLDSPLPSATDELAPWHIAGMLSKSTNHLALADMLRKTEGYQLLDFLLANQTGKARTGKTLDELAKEYGLSSVHFRRLCKRALGGPVKAGLMEWRAMQSLLDLMGGNFAHTRIAMDNGYASSSHFARDIKQLFGVSPCDLL